MLLKCSVTAWTWSKTAQVHAQSAFISPNWSKRWDPSLPLPCQCCVCVCLWVSVRWVREVGLWFLTMCESLFLCCYKVILPSLAQTLNQTSSDRTLIEPLSTCEDWLPHLTLHLPSVIPQFVDRYNQIYDDGAFDCSYQYFCVNHPIFMAHVMYGFILHACFLYQLNVF